jgi:hypothetical protein
MAGGSVTRAVNGKGSTTRDIVAKLWNLCNVLRDDGVTYTDYVTGGCRSWVLAVNFRFRE